MKCGVIWPIDERCPLHLVGVSVGWPVEMQLLCEVGVVVPVVASYQDHRPIEAWGQDGPPACTGGAPCPMLAKTVSAVMDLAAMMEQHRLLAQLRRHLLPPNRRTRR